MIDIHFRWDVSVDEVCCLVLCTTKRSRLSLPL